MTDLHTSHSFNSTNFFDDFFFNTNSNMRPNLNLSQPPPHTTTTSSATPYFAPSSLPLPAHPNFNFLPSSFLPSPPPAATFHAPPPAFYTNHVPGEEAEFDLFAHPPLPLSSSLPAYTPGSEPASNTALPVSSSSTAIKKASYQRSNSARKKEEDKAEERRRKNRVSSSKCYYARKQKIEQFEKSLTREKQRAISMYAKELELRNENARLKKELVLNNIRLPSHYLTAGKR